MLTLHNFGPNFGMPEASPFCLKAMVLLTMSGLPHDVTAGNLRKAPKGKLPLLDDDGVTIADSTFIRWHLESRHGVDFDAGLGDVDRAVGWACEKMCEDQLYWAVLHERWMIDANFDKGPRVFFNAVPAPLRPLVTTMVRRHIRRSLYGQGFGRHSRDEMLALAEKDVASLASILGDKPWLLGCEPTGSDATVRAAITSAAVPLFKTPLTGIVARYANLSAYRARGMARWFPDFKAAV